MASKEETRQIITDIRELIDRVDESIVWYILVRLTLARLIMSLKDNQSIPLDDPKREKKIRDSVEEYISSNYGGPEKDLEELSRSIGGMFNEVVALGKRLHRSQK